MRVYDIRHKDIDICYAVAGETRNKTILKYLEEMEINKDEYINYRGRLARDYNNKPIHTEQVGIIFTDIGLLLEKGYKSWWKCGGCGKEATTEPLFLYNPIEEYKCKKCGHIAPIPYAEE